MGAEVEFAVWVVNGGRGVIATGLNAGEAVVPTIDLTVEMGGIRKKVFKGEPEEAPVCGDPKIAVGVMLDLREVVVVQAVFSSESAIGAVFKMSQAVTGISDPEAAIGGCVEGPDGAEGGAIDCGFIDEFLSVDAEEVSLCGTDPGGPVGGFRNCPDGLEGNG